MPELLLKQEIKRQGSLSEFARKSGLHVSSVSRIANGWLQPFPGQVEKIVDALDWKGDPSPLFHESKVASKASDS